MLALIASQIYGENGGSPAEPPPSAPCRYGRSGPPEQVSASAAPVMPAGLAI